MNNAYIVACWLDTWSNVQGIMEDMTANWLDVFPSSSMTVLVSQMFGHAENLI